MVADEKTVAVLKWIKEVLEYIPQNPYGLGLIYNTVNEHKEEIIAAVRTAVRDEYRNYVDFFIKVLSPGAKGAGSPPPGAIVVPDKKYLVVVSDSSKANYYADLAREYMKYLNTMTPEEQVKYVQGVLRWVSTLDAKSALSFVASPAGAVILTRLAKDEYSDIWQDVVLRALRLVYMFTVSTNG